MLIQYFRGSYGKVEMGPMMGKYHADRHSDHHCILVRTEIYYQGRS